MNGTLDIDRLSRLICERFTGREDVCARQTMHGAYQPCLAPLNLPLAARHLQGSATLGSYVVREDGQTVMWGAIDFDLPQFEGSMDRLLRCLELTHRHLDHFRIPHVIEDSGNKGAHLWIFCVRPLPANLVRRALSCAGYAALCDMDRPWRNGDSPALEVFPKQDTVAEGKYGNLVKIPWGKHRKSHRRALLCDYELQPYPTWDEQASALEGCARVGETELEALLEELPEPETGKPSGGILTGPYKEGFGRGDVPCTSPMFFTPVADGARNARLLGLAIRQYRSGVSEKQAVSRLQRFNAQLAEPPEEERVIEQTVRSVYSKGYSGLQCDQFASFCAGAECAIYRTIHKIAPPEIEEAEKVLPTTVTDLQRLDTDPPIWRCFVRETEIELVGDELLRWNSFRSKVFQRLGIIFDLPRAPRQSAQAAWELFLAPLLETCEVSEAPEDASASGRIRQVMLDWLESNVQPQESFDSIEELADAIMKPDEPGYAYFRFSRLMTILERVLADKPKEHQVWSIIHAMEGDSFVAKVRRRPMRLVKLPWSVTPSEAVTLRVA